MVARVEGGHSENALSLDAQLSSSVKRFITVAAAALARCSFTAIEDLRLGKIFGCKLLL